MILSTTDCPDCKGTGEQKLTSGDRKGETVGCGKCHSKGKIDTYETIDQDERRSRLEHFTLQIYQARVTGNTPAMITLDPHKILKEAEALMQVIDNYLYPKKS